MATNRICSVEGCGKPTTCRDFCNIHYQRWYRHGDPLGGNPTGLNEVQRFFNQIVLPYKGKECLIWPYSRNGWGYGRMQYYGRLQVVSRLVCTHTNGPAPTPRHEAAHSCGRGQFGCVSGGHLSWKSNSGNQADKVSHGTDTRGERSWSSKIDREEVIRIRSLKGVVTTREIALQTGLSASYVAKIQNRKKWAWLE